MKIVDLKTIELIDAIGADSPAPGGGAVAGLAGGIGVALTMMVNGLTLSKPGFEDAHDLILDSLAKGNELKARFIDVMNRDADAFDTLIDSYAMPKETPAQKAVRRGAIQASLRNCTEVPITMMRICAESIDLLYSLIGNTNPNLASDLGIAALMLKSSMQSAWLNVLINLSSLKDRSFAETCYKVGDALLTRSIPIADASYDKVLGLLSSK